MIRMAVQEDGEAIAAIYAPYVRDTSISFEIDPPSGKEMAERIRQTVEHLPWLVLERDGEVLGYAYAGPHRARAAYRWSVDVSVYVDGSQRRTGIGRALYTSLFKILIRMGFYNAYAGVTLPNPASVGLHESIGFQSVGIYHRTGYKQGVWHDVGWWELELRPRAIPPEEPVELKEVMGLPGWEKLLESGLTHLR